MLKKGILANGLAFITSIFLLATATPSVATVYYISSSIGNDAWEGTTPEPMPPENPTNGPWKTIKQVNKQAFEPGDSIKFKRGDTWVIWASGDGVLTPPTSGIDDNNRITFTNYGTGNLPIFRGGTEITTDEYQWTLSSRGTNEYYCEAAGGGWHWWWAVPPIVEADEEGLLWKDTPGNLADHEWGWGDNDSLGFGTIYIRDDAGAPGSLSGFQSVWAGLSNCIQINNKSYIDIDGIETRNGTISIRILNDAHHNRIMNCVCRYNHDGIDAWADKNVGGDNEIYNCNCSYNYRHGIMSSNEGKGFSLIHYNLCEYNNQFGMWVAQKNGSCIIEYNECRYNSKDIKQKVLAYWGIEVVQNSSSDHHIIRYNKSHHNDRPYPKYSDGGGINIRANNAKVYYNLCYLNKGPGIGGGHMNEPSHYGIKIYHNVCSHNCQAGSTACSEFFFCSGFYGTVIRNNIVQKGNANHYLVYTPNTSLDIDYNYYYSPDGKYNFYMNRDYSSFYEWQTFPSSKEVHSFCCGDPKFVDATNGDFHISGDSPCIDKGDDSISSETEAKDYWGGHVPYPERGSRDIGAHEYQEGDWDNDGISDDDNCPYTPNGPKLGICAKQLQENFTLIKWKNKCTGDKNCGVGEFCMMNQEDNDENGIGDACECHADFDLNGNVDIIDVMLFKNEFGRNTYRDPCASDELCYADFDCNGSVDGIDTNVIKFDYGRNIFNNPCQKSNLTSCVYK